MSFEHTQDKTYASSDRVRARVRIRSLTPPCAFFNTRWGREEAAGLHDYSTPGFDDPQEASSPDSTSSDGGDDGENSSNEDFSTPRSGHNSEATYIGRDMLQPTVSILDQRRSSNNYRCSSSPPRTPLRSHGIGVHVVVEQPLRETQSSLLSERLARRRAAAAAQSESTTHQPAPTDEAASSAKPPRIATFAQRMEWELLYAAAADALPPTPPPKDPPKLQKSSTRSPVALRVHPTPAAMDVERYMNRPLPALPST